MPVKQKSVPWLTRFVASLPPRRHRFKCRISPCETSGRQSGARTGFFS